jgi:carotenoid cleavage dioxygenase
MLSQSLQVFRGFIPWILYFIVASSQHVFIEIAAFTAVIATITFNLNGLRKKFILDWCTLIYFTFLFAMYFLPWRTWFSHNAYILSNIIFPAIIWLSILIGKPFTLQYAREQVGEIYWLTPTFKFINYAISSVWAIATSLVALDSFLEFFNIVSSNWLADIVQVALILFAIWFTQWFPDWYQGYLFRKLSKKPADLSSNPFLKGNYEPVHDELSVANLSIIGEIPKDFQGIYMRNGPNPALPQISYTYPLDGDGMLHAIYLDEGKASYRNRFVETKGLLAERKAGHALYGGVTHPIPVDPKLIGKNGDPGPIKNGAFIHIIKHANQYLALWESGSAYEVSAQLQTKGEWCPQSSKQPFHISAHTRVDIKTGALYGFTYELQPPYLSFFIINRDGKLIKTIAIDKPYPSMLHDFVLTENHIVFFDCPAVFNTKALATGDNMLQWQRNLGVKIGIINKTTEVISWIKTEPFFVFHFVNAFEKNNQIIVDYVKHQELNLLNTKNSSNKPMLYRTTIDIDAKSVKHQQLDDRLVEFPRINENFTAKTHRYLYVPTKNNSKQFNALLKYDLQQGNSLLHDFGDSSEIGEAVFASTNNDIEDAGYVMLFVYDKKENNSRFVLLNAQDFTAEPAAIIKLPRRVPHGLHGSWLPGVW